MATFHVDSSTLKEREQKHKPLRHAAARLKVEETSIGLSS
jgi:hypothetical protein